MYTVCRFQVVSVCCINVNFFGSDAELFMQVILNKKQCTNSLRVEQWTRHCQWMDGSHIVWIDSFAWNAFRVCIIFCGYKLNVDLKWNYLTIDERKEQDDEGESQVSTMYKLFVLSLHYPSAGCYIHVRKHLPDCLGQVKVRFGQAFWKTKK